MKFIVIILIFVIVSCSANRPLGSNGFNSGYAHKELSEGVYFVWVEGIGGLWDNKKEMKKTWHSHSTTLCENGFDTFDYKLTTISSSSTQIVVIGNIATPYNDTYSIPVIEGFIRCNNAPTSLDETKKLISNFFWPYG